MNGNASVGRRRSGGDWITSTERGVGRAIYGDLGDAVITPAPTSLWPGSQASPLLQQTAGAADAGGALQFGTRSRRSTKAEAAEAAGATAVPRLATLPGTTADATTPLFEAGAAPPGAPMSNGGGDDLAAVVRRDG